MLEFLWKDVNWFIVVYVYVLLFCSLVFYSFFKGSLGWKTSRAKESTVSRGKLFWCLYILVVNKYIYFFCIVSPSTCFLILAAILEHKKDRVSLLDSSFIKRAIGGVERRRMGKNIPVCSRRKDFTIKCILSLPCPHSFCGCTPRECPYMSLPCDKYINLRDRVTILSRFWAFS